MGVTVTGSLCSCVGVGVDEAERGVTVVDSVGGCNVIQLLPPSGGRDGRIDVCKKRLRDRCLRIRSDKRSVGYALEEGLTCLN